MYAKIGTPIVAVRVMALATHAISVSDNGASNGEASDCKCLVTGDIQPDSSPNDKAKQLAETEEITNNMCE